MAQLLTLEFCFKIVFWKLVFFKNLILPAEEDTIYPRNKIVAQLLTQQRAKCGPVNDPTAYVYVYICML